MKPMRRVMAGLQGVLLTLAVVFEADADVKGQWSDVPAEDVLSAVVGVRAYVPDAARTAEALGIRRIGSGVVIDEQGLIVTIGYLILEAERVEVLTGEDEPIPATLIAYDGDSGFGLIRAARVPDVRPMTLGDSRRLEANDPVLVASFRLGPGITPAKVASRRQFAGYWEYLLDDAIFTTPPHRSFGGAALIAKDGRLVGIGSLLVGDALSEDEPSPGNMFVPVEALEPVLGDLLTEGRRSGPTLPWLGVFTQEVGGRVFVTATAADGPAEMAGLEPGDAIIGVGGDRIDGMADLFRRVRDLGAAGIEVPLDVVRRRSGDLAIQRVVIRSADRTSWLRHAHGD